MATSEKVWKLHQDIYRELKSRAESLESSSIEYTSYEKNQRDYACRNFNNSSINELFSSIRKSNVVFLGDFHSFDQNSRNLERLTRELLKEQNQFTIGVELVDRSQQYAIELYLNHHISELEFLEEIEYHKTWRFPWSYYRPFFIMAKEYNLSIIALNSTGTLEERDEVASDIIYQELIKESTKRLLVLFGELHIVPNKLPLKLKNKIKAHKKNYHSTIIHQNLDEVFWKIHEVDIERYNQIVKFSDSEFSLHTAPPWIKYESMIYWYENLSDDPEFELHDYIFNTGILNLHSNVLEDFIFLCHKIIETLGFSITDKQIEDINLYEHQNLGLISDKIDGLSCPSLRELYKNLMIRGKVFKIPFTNSYYCSSYSINRISTLCGLHIHDNVIKKSFPDYENLLISKNTEEKFIFFVKQHAVAYLSSKIINPYRKCDLYLDFKEKVFFGQESKENLEIFKTTIRVIENNPPNPLNYEIDKIQTHESACNLGFAFGEILYDDFLIQGSRFFADLVDYLFNKDFTYTTFKKKIGIVFPKNKLHKHKKRMF